MAKSPKTPEEKAAHQEWVRQAAEDNLRARGRAITSKEKRAVVERLLKVWEKFPELRFSQLVVNVMTSDFRKMDTFFYVEDKILCDAAEAFEKKQSK